MLHKIELFLARLFILATLHSCNSDPTEAEHISSTPNINYSVTKYFPHDTTSFTEGFLVYNGQLFESTGSPKELIKAKSLVGITSLATGKIDGKIELDRAKYFGEGIVLLKNKLYQLTYKNQLCFVYDAKSFKQIGQFSYPNKEGWGLTTNGTELIMSDGTANLTLINPTDFKPTRVLSVTENGIPRDSLNELEYINGFIYANIWVSNYIVKIAPSNGRVVGRLDLGSLSYEAKNKYPGSDVLNGIAYDPASDKIYVTGKCWPNIYQIDFPH